MISFNFVVAFSFFLSFFRGELGINERNKRCCLLESRIGKLRNYGSLSKKFVKNIQSQMYLRSCSRVIICYSDNDGFNRISFHEDGKIRLESS